MPRIGSTTPPANGHDRIGAYRQQNAYALTSPGHITVLTLGAYVKGLSGNGSISYRLCIWNNSGDPTKSNGLLGNTALLTATAAALDPANLDKVTADLLTPVELADGQGFYVGISANTASGTAHQWGTRSTGTAVYTTDTPAGGGWPASLKGYEEVSGGNVVAWVEDYATIGSAKVRRSGVWVASTGIQVRRGGVWVDASSVKVRRAGAWVDAS